MKEKQEIHKGKYLYFSLERCSYCLTSIGQAVRGILNPSETIYISGFAKSKEQEPTGKYILVTL